MQIHKDCDQILVCILTLMHSHTNNLTNTHKMVCVCLCYVCLSLCECVTVMHVFVTVHFHCDPHCIASWHEELISCPLTQDQPFHKLLCKSVNPFGSYSPFSDRPLPKACPLLATRHKHK